MKAKAKKILIVTYYWPPSGGSGVQRWMYFAKYLQKLGWEPIVITVDETQASYPVFDSSLIKEVEGIRVIKTSTREPLRWYSRLTSGNVLKGLPQGEVPTTSTFGKIAAYIRGNFFIPDARKGWIPFAVKAAQQILEQEKIYFLITTGPPHSTHLAGMRLAVQFKLNWWVDFRDPWADIFYNKQLRRTSSSQAKDTALEKLILQNAKGVITTTAGDLHQSLKQKAPDQKYLALPNGYDADLMQQTQAAPKKKEFHIVYTGLLTQNQTYSTLVDVLNELSQTFTLHFSLAGNINPVLITELKTSLPKVEVQYLGYLPHAQAIALMKSADLLLNFIFKGAETQMISGKLLEYMATEVPILSLGNPNSEAAQFLTQGTHAWMVQDQDKTTMKLHLKFLLEQKKQFKNKTPHLVKWTREALTKRLIEEILK
ncbi:glycosyltransferase [Flavobacteriaceae bacterium]|nr:glycosyltransferase [Flavobacteriaceae bacterium]MDA9015697.1 glycosyltransferase [Flavobacteriaceae bacterium]MDC3354849.1 glycosyltransferase [Flavobacteriaceae bacterium]